MNRQLDAINIALVIALTIQMNLLLNYATFMNLQIDKDPDVRMEKLFVLGETMPKRVSSWL